MKILYIQEFGDTNGGVQKLITQLAMAMATKGHDVTILSHRQDDYHYAELLRQGGVKFVNLNMRHRFSPWKALKYIILIRSQHYDIVHTNHSIPQAWSLIVSKFCPRSVGWITTEHATNSIRRKFNWFRFFDRQIYRCYHRVVSVSLTVQHSLLSWTGDTPGNRYVVVRNGIDTKTLAHANPIPRTDLSLHKDDIVVCSIGRLSPEKDFSTFIRAFCFLPQQYKGIIVGDGELKGSLQEEISRLQLSDRIQMTGTRKDIGSILKASDIYVSTSTSEGFGLTVIEASACGIPVIASRIPAFEELLGPAQLFPPSDSRALAEIIQHADSIPRPDDKFICQFSIQTMTDNYLQIYNQIKKQIDATCGQ